MKNKISTIYKNKNQFLPLSFKYISVVKIMEQKDIGKVYSSEIHQTESYKLDIFYKKSNTILPKNFFK
jgi:hypothetical protein